MFDDPQFFPFLQHTSWRGAASCLVRPLVAPPGDLLIAYGIAGEAQNQYLTQEAQEKSGYSAEDMHDQAISNLRQRRGKIPWSPITIGGEDVLIRSGDPVISSDVLNPRGMQKLSGAFAGGTIYLGIPSVFTVVAHDDPELLGGIVRGLHREAEQEKAGALSALVYRLDEGAIASAYTSAPMPATTGGLDPQKLTRLVVEGIAAMALVMSRSQDGSAPTMTFWDTFMRKLGNRSPGLAPLGEVDAEAFTGAVTTLAAQQRPVAAVRTLAKVVRHAVLEADGRRIANAAIGAALAQGQAGTGFFGLGRSLPKHLRHPLWGMAGILGADLP